MQEAENLKERILKTATAKMTVAGVRSVSIDDICRELGISKKTFYVYFESKDQLLEAFLEQHVAHMRRQIWRQLDNHAIIKIIKNRLPFFKKINDVRQIPSLVYDLRKYYPQLMQAHLLKVREVVQEAMAEFLRRGMEEGIFREDLDVEKTSEIFAALHRIMMDKLLETQQPKIVTNAKYALDIFFRGLISHQGEQMILEELKSEK